MYTKSHEDRKLERERAACDAAACWGSEQPLTVDLLLLVAERVLADAGRRLATEHDGLSPGIRYDLQTTAARLSRETEALRFRLADDLADLQRIERERYVYDRQRCEDHADALPEHLMDLGEGMLRAITPAKEGR